MKHFQNFNSIDWDKFLHQKALEVKLTPSQARVFLTRFDQDNWLDRIEDIWHQSDVNSFESFVRHSTNIYRIFKSDCPEISKGAGNFTIVRDWLLREFEHQVDVDNSTISSSAIRRICQTECEQNIIQTGALIRIKAPSKMGKSQLLNNILAFGEQQEYRVVHINFLQLESSKFDSLDKLLRWFCVYICDALELGFNLSKYWNEDRGSMLSCTRYLGMILADSEQPLILGLDEVDRLLNYPEISQDFFYLLRSWYEEASNDELWEKLRLIVVYSTEDFGSLDINQSPFNIGLPIEIESFNLQEINQLAVSYKLNFTELETTQIMKILGGHPYLVDLMFSNLANHQNYSLEQLLKEAASNTGIYSSYLIQHLINLQANTQLTEIFLAILNSPKPIRVDTILGYQLYRMGLIKWSKNNAAVPSCELYKQYFLPRLTTD